MVTISGFSGDSNDDPSKKPQEQRRAVTLNNPPDELPLPCPYDLALISLAKLGRLHYPALSIVCPDLGRLIYSPVLYEKRQELKTTEPVLYALLGFPYPTDTLPRWHILNRNNRLAEINSLPPMPSGSAVVVIGYEIYVIGGRIGHVYQRDVTVIDCRYHTSRTLPQMRKARYLPVAEVMDGKIYVIGGCEVEHSDWVEVFDLEDGTWSSVPGPYAEFVGAYFVSSALLERTIHVLNPPVCLMYDPNEEVGSRWITIWGHLTRMIDFWHASSCVIGGLLYTIDGRRLMRHSIIVYDTHWDTWEPVKVAFEGEGLLGLPVDLSYEYYHSRMTSFDGKLVLLVCNNLEIWCVVIALEKRVLIAKNSSGVPVNTVEFSGRVERVESVFTSPRVFYIEHCLSVTL